MNKDWLYKGVNSLKNSHGKPVEISRDLVQLGRQRQGGCR